MRRPTADGKNHQLESDHSAIDLAAFSLSSLVVIITISPIIPIQYFSRFLYIPRDMPWIPRGFPQIITGNIPNTNNTTVANTTGAYGNGTYPNPPSSRLPWLPWTDTPLDGTFLSASGLLVLADLSTIAKRTVLKGGSTYVDAFILAPRLHQQQLCESLASTLNAKLSNRGTRGTFGSGTGNKKTTIRNIETGMEEEVTNTVMLQYLHRMAEDLRRGTPLGSRESTRGVTLRVGQPPPSAGTISRLLSSSLRQRIRERGATPLFKGIPGTLLYVASPVMTAMSMSLMLATGDWWGVGILLALILARLFNIWIIRSRTAHTRLKPSKADVKAEAAKTTGEGGGMVTTLAPPVPVAVPFPPPPDLPPPPTTIRRSSLDGVRADGSLGVDGSVDGSVDPQPLQPLQTPDVNNHLEVGKFIEAFPGISRTPTGSNWTINIPGAPPIRLQGLPSDIESLVSGSWLGGKSPLHSPLSHPRNRFFGIFFLCCSFSIVTKRMGSGQCRLANSCTEKTDIEGYLEASSKMIVYGVAACSGNMKQTGNIILGALLVVSAAALALANSE